MKSSYKKLGPYIQPVDIRNIEDRKDNLLGVSTNKVFIPSVANTVGTDFTKYKKVKKGQFTYVPDTSRRGDRIGIAMLENEEGAIVSQAYTVFEVKDHDQLLPEYLMMWFRRPEFDRYARFKSHGSVREIFDWEEMCDVELPVPHIDKQREIVKEYHTIVDRIALNEVLNRKLEETAQAIYKQWFVDFEFPVSKEYADEIGKPEMEGKPYKSSCGEMVWNEELEKEIPVGWRDGNFLSHAKIIMGQSPKGETYNFDGIGTPLINGPVEFGDYYTTKIKWTDSPTKLCEPGDLIICVRGSTTGRFVKSDDQYCLGRGVCSFQGKASQYFVDYLYKSKLIEMLTLTTGSTFPNWGRDTLSEFSVIVPKKNVVTQFDTIISKIIHRIEVGSKESITLTRLSDLLLQKMTKAEAIA